MRGLAFPADAVFQREESYDHGTPFSTGDDIPIDPALNSPPVDPALLAESDSGSYIQVLPPPPPAQHITLPQVRQYSQGPQGDPFAPPPSYLLVEEPPQAAPKPIKKKRKPPRETECGFCHGDGSKNRNGEPESMLTCAECRRSGHPSCLHVPPNEALRTYDWRCVECKICDICQEKGDDNRLLFCDCCDRGWHMDCLIPSMAAPPEGRWLCPRCQPPPPPFGLPPGYSMGEFSALPVRESSVASSSRGYATKIIPAADGTPRMSYESDVEVDVGATPMSTRPSRKKKSRPKEKPTAEEMQTEELASPSNARPSKRIRIRISSPVPPTPTPQSAPTIRLRLPPRGKGKQRDDEGEEVKKGMFDDYLDPRQRDVSATTITSSDKLRFDKSRSAVEVPPPPLPPPLEPVETSVAGPSTRPLRSHHPPPISMTISAHGQSESPAPQTPGPAASPAPPTLRIRKIRFGEFDIDTWYDAPFPEEYANIPNGRLWICEFCLKYMKGSFAESRHKLKCKTRHPPGDEIYRDGAISIFEVDGRKNKIYCQNLCLLSKMFLDHKSLFYDVEPFLFYVITELDETGARFVGYFSKEKRSPKDYNVSCIMTLPVRQRQGWGNLLIDFSYLLSKKEQRTGSPEKPLSALGALGYKNYWTFAIMRYLKTTAPENPTLEDISIATSMTIEDICTTLSQQHMITIRDGTPPPRPLPGQSIKFPKGRKNGVARKHLQRTQTQDDEKVKGPFVAPKNYEIHWDPGVVEQYWTKLESKNYLRLKPEKLKWSPFIIARTRKSDSLQSDVQDAAGSQTQSAEPESTPKSKKLTQYSDAHKRFIGTGSPAAALFDDLVPALVTPPLTAGPSTVSLESTANAPDALSQTPEGPERPRTPPPKAPVMVRTPSTRRSTRMSSLAGSVSPDKHRASQPLSPERRMSTRRTRSALATTVTAEPNGDKTHEEKIPKFIDHVAQDAALAARLALEEVRPRRQLRSRSGTAQQELKRELSSQHSISPRKRRRIASPEPESTLAALPTPYPTRRTSNRRPVQSPESPILRRRPVPSRATNGVKKKRTTGRIGSKSPEEALEDGHDILHGRLNGDSCAHVHSPEEISPRVEADVAPGRQAREEPQRVPDRRPPESLSIETDDMKYEDVDTPLTGITSGQSVPSDDTIAVDDGSATEKAALAGQITLGPDEPLRPAQAEALAKGGAAQPDQAAVLSTGLADLQICSVVRQDGDIEMDADGDADAEGEDDIDAEGELDAEGEEDAEGEPDLDI